MELCHAPSRGPWACPWAFPLSVLLLGEKQAQALSLVPMASVY